MRRLVSAGIALSALTLVLASTQAAQAQIFAEDFGTTLDGTFTGTTGYTNAPNTTGGAGTFRIVTNATQANTNFASYGSTGAFFAFNGAGTATPLYSTTALTLGAGTYQFSFFGASSFGVSPPTLTASYSGTQSGTLGSTFTPTGTGVFTQFASIVTLTGGTYTFNIADSNFASNGNDGGIDTVRVTAAPEPGSLALLLPVMGTVGMVLRRRRK